MTPSSVTAARPRTAISAIDSEETLAAFETSVVEALAQRIDCTYSDASGIVDQHSDLIEAGFEDRASASAIAREIDAKSLVGSAA